MSASISVGKEWGGIESIRNLVVFGDSYSSVGYSVESPYPSDERPLGVECPGTTSCEIVDEATKQAAFEPNWVGHFVQEMNRVRTSRPLLAFDYAIAGDTVARMKLKQVGKEFLPHVGVHPEWAPWTSSDTLFVTWIGINDCTWNLRLSAASAQASLDDLFAAHDKLYQAGARNFCLIDVPAVHTFPKGPKTPKAKAAYQSWNPLLRQGAESFVAGHPDATIFIFSSWDLFARILADPSSFGLDCKAEGRAALFVDGFHPSSAVHKVIARELLSFLRQQPPFTSYSV
ncbi:hypothetical protein OH77DRAFT_1403711 [Trametes cingulata]|nr:hypothetical protein OH77DRAFT_1403711 [Trametes cingulata]